MANNYFFYVWRLDLRTLRLLNFANDLGAFFVCFPNYAMLMVPALYSRTNAFMQLSSRPIEEQESMTEIEKEQRVNAYLVDKDISEVFEEISGKNSQKEKED